MCYLGVKSDLWETHLDRRVSFLRGHHTRTPLEVCLEGIFIHL